MVAIVISVGKETSATEESALLDAFTGIDVEVNKGIIRLGEGDLPMIVSFSVGAISSGIFWDLLKASIQRLRAKEGTEIKRKIILELVYKKNNHPCHQKFNHFEKFICCNHIN